MQVRLSAKAQAFLRQVVAEGKFESTDEVIEEAVTMFAQELLRRDIDAGLKDIREGRVRDWDVEEVKRDFLRRVKRKKKAS